MGRKQEKDLIKTGGENVYPAEVESVILKHPQIKEVVVIGVPDPKWVESIKAVCVVKEVEWSPKTNWLTLFPRRLPHIKTKTRSIGWIPTQDSQRRGWPGKVKENMEGNLV